MTQKPIQLHHLTLSFPHKVCFEDFNGNVPFGSRIGILGDNGTGKSTLLKIILGDFDPSEGHVKIPENTKIGYVPQMIDHFSPLSGGERFNEALTQALTQRPDVLLLDEPTNHLDLHNRNALIRLLRTYRGTLIIVSHDVEVLKNCCQTFWHLDSGKINVFSGEYDHYRREIEVQRASLEHELFILERHKKEMHHALMKEQKRASKSRSKGEKSIEQRKWPTIVSHAKARRAEETSGLKKANIRDKKEELITRLSSLCLSEVIKPTFSLEAFEFSEKQLLSISQGELRYENQEVLLKNIHLSLLSHDRVAILGKNGSGKSTLIKAILNADNVLKSGYWSLPKRCDIGYLDQHYKTLDFHKSILETIEDIQPFWSHEDIRKHLNTFLFRKNEEVYARVSTLSGGEKARLTLAQIAAKPPKLLILDEMTNNLDLKTRNHVIEVLKVFPGALIVISHDNDFLKKIHIQDTYEIKDNVLVKN
ncbi:MAG: ABC-F family ATP-binding cassette domain-containing protein [Proteobacteria bacterium]|nr:ABC-F family ATP-binding cassette domain-containing protein [Pseudomonadota bacterium]